MKNLTKLFGVIALAAVMVFTMASCLTLGDGAGGIGGGAGGYDSMPTMEWPSNETWGRYNLSGLQLPPGDFRIVGQEGGRFGGPFNVALMDADRAAYDNLKGQISGMSGWALMEENTGDEPGSIAAAFVNEAAMTILGLIYTGPNDNIVAMQIQ